VYDFAETVQFTALLEAVFDFLPEYVAVNLRLAMANFPPDLGFCAPSSPSQLLPRNNNMFGQHICHSLVIVSSCMTY
jgi:hypothetical protein